MFGRVLLAVGILLLLEARAEVLADPITYAFTGTFPSSSDINGVNQFSGTFTIDGSPTVTATGVTEGGSDVSITVNVGGQVVNFANMVGNIYSQATFNASSIAAGASNNPYGPTGPAVIAFGVDGSTETPTSSVTFGLSSYPVASPQQLANISSLSLPLESSSIYVTETSGQQYQRAFGAITSIELVSTPEPGTLVIFGAIAVSAIARRLDVHHKWNSVRSRQRERQHGADTRRCDGLGHDV
jgi:hypothetical protein